MRTTLTTAGILAALALAGCQSQPEQASADQMADKLEQAADQSDPKAAAVIDQRAEELRGSASVAPAGEPGSYAQKTMQEAGAAQAETVAPKE